MRRDEEEERRSRRRRSKGDVQAGLEYNGNFTAEKKDDRRETLKVFHSIIKKAL